MILHCDLIRLERTNIVTKTEERVKVDLTVMARHILHHARSCNPRSTPISPELLNRLAVQFNQGALLQYQFGATERAETLCRSAILLFKELSATSMHRELCLANIVAPHINLARISGHKGQVHKSLATYSNLYSFSIQKEDLMIGDECIPARDVPAMCEASPYLCGVMQSCRVIDAARVLQTNERYGDLLRLAETGMSFPERQDRHSHQLLHELRMQALLGLKEYEAAATAALDCSRSMVFSCLDHLFIQVKLAQIYREQGHHSQAAALLHEVGPYVAKIVTLPAYFLGARHVAYRIALEHYALSDAAKAIEWAEKALDLCRTVRDQSGIIKSMVLLLRLCNSSGAARSQHRWFEELESLASSCCLRYERACAYWELAVSRHISGKEECAERQSARGFLELSYHLYSTMPFVDSRQSCKELNRLFAAWYRDTPASRLKTTGTTDVKAPEIDEVYELLLSFAPQN